MRVLRRKISIRPRDGDVGHDLRRSPRSSRRTRGARPPVETTFIGSPNSALMRATRPLDQADIAPEDAGLHAGDGTWCRSPAWASRPRCAAAAPSQLTSASMLRLMPGAITPPTIAAVLVDHVEGRSAVPKSTVISTGVLGNSDAGADGLQMRSAPASCGPSIDLDAVDCTFGSPSNSGSSLK